MPTAQETLDPNESIEKTYSHDIRVIRVDRGEDHPLYRFDAPLYTPKDSDTTPTWETADLADLYACVYVVANGFREEKTGRRGIPPEVERVGREAVVAYLTTQDGISTEWLSNFYDLPRERIWEYRSRIRARAEEIVDQEEADDE